MSNHTPGPWVYDPNNLGSYGVPHVGLVCEDGSSLPIMLEEGPDMEANARLIAAAPDMLEALKLVQRSLAGKDTNLPYLAKKVDDAIAKGTGEEESE